MSKKNDGKYYEQYNHHDVIPKVNEPWKVFIESFYPFLHLPEVMSEYALHHLTSENDKTCGTLLIELDRYTKQTKGAQRMKRYTPTIATTNKSHLRDLVAMRLSAMRFIRGVKV